MYFFIRGFSFLFKNGLFETIKKLNSIIKLKLKQSSYLKNILYISNNEKIIQKNTDFPNITIDIIVYINDTTKKLLKLLISSLQLQTSGNWELHIADLSEKKDKIIKKTCLNAVSKNIRIHYYEYENKKNISDILRKIINKTNNKYIGFIEQNSFLHPSALFEILSSISCKKADFIYSDEILYKGNKIIKRNYSSDFSSDTLNFYNYINNLCVFERSLFQEIGNSRRYDNYRDFYYDLVLRLTEKAKIIYNIHKLICFKYKKQINKKTKINANNNIIMDHFSRINFTGTIQDTSFSFIKKIEYNIKNNPLVSILIPNMDHTIELSNCISSILNKSTYKNIEIIIIENNSNDINTFNYYESLSIYDNIRIIKWENENFNFSVINNFGFSHAKGEYIILLNNDIEIISSNWIQEMLMFAQQKNIGAVGAKLYYPDNTIQHAGVYLNQKGLPYLGYRHTNKKHTGEYYELIIPRTIDAVIGACMMIPSNIFREVNGMDEQFEIEYNDVDLCLKIRDTGYLIIWTPFAEAYHLEGKSRGYNDTAEKINKNIHEKNIFLYKWQNKFKD